MAAVTSCVVLALAAWMLPAGAAPLGVSIPIPPDTGDVMVVSAGDASYPIAIAALPSGNLAWVDDQWNKVGILNTQTLTTSTASLWDKAKPTDLAVDASGTIWVIGQDGQLGKVSVSNDGTSPTSVDVVFKTPSFGSNGDASLAVATNGKVFWADLDHSCLWAYNPSDGRQEQFNVSNMQSGVIVATMINQIMVPTNNVVNQNYTWSVVDAGNGSIATNVWAGGVSSYAVVGRDGLMWTEQPNNYGTTWNGQLAWFNPVTQQSGFVNVNFGATPSSMTVDQYGRIWWFGNTNTSPYLLESFDPTTSKLTDYPFSPAFAASTWHMTAAADDGLWVAGAYAGRFIAMTSQEDPPVVACTASGTVPVGVPVDCSAAFGTQPTSITGTWRIDGQPVATPGGQPPTPTLADSGSELTADLTVTLPGVQVTQQVSIAPTTIQKTVVTGYTPTSGPADGGIPITFAGSGFYAGQQLLINGNLAQQVGQVTPTALTVTLPPNAPRGLLRAKATRPAVDTFYLAYPDGEQDQIAGQFDYSDAQQPSITSISPASASATGATSFTITGTGFATGANVVFTSGGQSAPAGDVTVTSPTTIAGTSPPTLPVGVADVTVRNPAGLSTTDAAAFTLYGPPSPAAITPSIGSAAGGEPVTINGSGFLAGAQVYFHDVLATNVTVKAGGTITATAPAGTAGQNAEVVVSNVPGGGATVPGGFAYVTRPTVTDVTPALGPTTGGSMVVIAGTGFVDPATVLVSASGTSAPATAVNVVSSSEIHSTLPAFAPGPADVSVTTGNGTGSLANGFLYQVNPTPAAAPSVVSVSPNAGSPQGGTSVTVLGSGFTDDECVLAFGGVAAQGEQVVASTRITARTPGGAPGAADVTVTCPQSGTGTLSNGFTFEGSPQLTLVDPLAGDAAGGTPITLTGSGFASTATVTVGGAEATSVVVQDAGTITAVTPPGTPGLVDVTVTNPGYEPSTLSDGYIYTSSPSPSPTASPTPSPTDSPSPSPTASPTASPTDSPSPSPSPTGSPTASPTATPAPAPAPAPAPPPPPLSTPSIFAVSPNQGPLSGCERITIKGNDLRTGARVLVGGVAATDVSLVASTVIQATTPAGQPGAADVVVVNPDGAPAFFDNGYTYEAPPMITSVEPSVIPVVGDTTVTINGSGFAADATVMFGAVEAYDVTVVDGTTITVVSPVNRQGPTDVTVTNPNVGTTTTAGGVDYQNLPQQLRTRARLPRDVSSKGWTTLVPPLVTNAGERVRTVARCYPARSCQLRRTAAGLQIRPTTDKRRLTVRVALGAPPVITAGYSRYRAHGVIHPHVTGGAR